MFGSGVLVDGELIVMGDAVEQPGPEEYVQAIERAFARCPSLSGLRLLSAEARLGFATVRFEGPVGDFRGPYGAMVRLPKEQHDDLWNRCVDDRNATVDDWAHASIAMRAVRAHTLSQDLTAGTPWTASGGSSMTASISAEST